MVTDVHLSIKAAYRRRKKVVNAERKRESDRQTDRERERQTDRESDRQTETEIDMNDHFYPYRHQIYPLPKKGFLLKNKHQLWSPECCSQTNRTVQIVPILELKRFLNFSMPQIWG